MGSQPRHVREPSGGFWQDFAHIRVNISNASLESYIAIANSLQLNQGTHLADRQTA